MRECGLFSRRIGHLKVVSPSLQVQTDDVDAIRALYPRWDLSAPVEGKSSAERPCQASVFGRTYLPPAMEGLCYQANRPKELAGRGSGGNPAVGRPVELDL